MFCCKKRKARKAAKAQAVVSSLAAVESALEGKTAEMFAEKLTGNKKALKFEVVTDRADELAEVLLRQMRHGVTVIPAEGMFSKQEKKLLVCIVNRHQIVQFQNILCRFPGSFAYVSEVTETMGNFKHITH